jgi:hypothetical protein
MTFVINGEVWQVRLVPAGHHSLRRPNGSASVGCCDDRLKTIFIDRTLHGRFFLEVLAHEITHAAMFSYNIEMTYEQEELVANMIAKYGHEVLSIADSVFKKIKRGYY